MKKVPTVFVGRCVYIAEHACVTLPFKGSGPFVLMEFRDMSHSSKKTLMRRMCEPNAIVACDTQLINGGAVMVVVQQGGMLSDRSFQDAVLELARETCASFDARIRVAGRYVSKSALH